MCSDHSLAQEGVGAGGFGFHRIFFNFNSIFIYYCNKVYSSSYSILVSIVVCSYSSLDDNFIAKFSLFFISMNLDSVQLEL